MPLLYKPVDGRYKEEIIGEELIMKLGIFGDLHFTSRGPSRRLDHFFSTQMRKFGEAFSIFEKEKCDIIFQPGDFFDSHTVSNEVKARIINFLRRFTYDHPIFCVSGQHDISGHSLHTLKNSPLSVLQSAEVIHILSSEAYLDSFGELGISIYGASYGEPIPKPKKGTGYNILVLHKMIGDRELYPGQELTKPNQFLRNNSDFNLVICGDYHYKFSSQYKGRTIINAGCLVRKTIGKFDLEHKPSVAIFDTDTNEVKFVELEIEPVEKVFDLLKVEKSDKLNTEKFIKALKEKRSSGEEVRIKNIILDIMKERESSDSVRNIIDKEMEEVQK